MTEFLLDERAERGNIDARIVGSGAKVESDIVTSAARELSQFQPDFAVVTTPNASSEPPQKGIKVLRRCGIPTLVITDGAGIGVLSGAKDTMLGCLIVEADSMIGARREFLDPTEMAIFNSDLMKILAVTGVYNVICREMDALIASITQGSKMEMPRLVVESKVAIEASGILNPYARAKAAASFEIAKSAAKVTHEACFVKKEPDEYIEMVAAAHEMIRVAGMLADEAREIDKNSDQVLRIPHDRDGTVLSKRRLMEKPTHSAHDP